MHINKFGQHQANPGSDLIEKVIHFYRPQRAARVFSRKPHTKEAYISNVWIPIARQDITESSDRIYLFLESN